MLNVEFPKKLAFLLNEPALYKVIWGGRGGLKTETVSRALLILALQKKLRIACFRELQTSIDESVYETLKNCIYDLDLEAEFEIQSKTIISRRTGSEFIFKGLRYNIDSIKSLARIDIAWVEEAANVSKTTWDKLEPTIRGKHETDPSGMGGPFGKGPEIIVTFNPEMDTDETYKRFVLKKDELYPDYILDEKTGKQVRYCIAVKTSYKDNKWLPQDLRLKMQIARIAAEKSGNWGDYLHVWEGSTKQVIDGAIYAEEIKKVIVEGRRKKVAYNPNKPVHTFWDIGFRDKTSIWFVQHAGVEYNVIRYYENQLQKMPFYIKYLQDLGYNYGTMNLPHDGDADTMSNITPKRQLIDIGYKVRIIKRPAKKLIGINAVRTLFDLCSFDEENTSDGWQCLCRYAYKVNEDNGVFSREPDHDTPWSHGADGFQTFGLSVKPEQELKKPRLVSSTRAPVGRTTNSWMGG
jgi:phage terminase large subunit